MNIRPFREIKRRKTKEINVGNIKVGGDNPISVQSMTNTLTKDVKETVNQIKQIEEAGADIVRVSCPDQDSTKALKDIIKNKPEYIIEEAVKGMLPKNKLGKKIFKKLKVYKGDHHPHESQEPKIWEPII